MKRIAIYPGTFDPITNGHIDIIERAANLFDELHVVIAENMHKIPLFNTQNRLTMCINSLNHLQNVFVVVESKLVTDYAKAIGAQALIRGIRNSSDVDYEFQLAFFNNKIAPQIATIFLSPSNEFIHISSTAIRELIKLKQDISSYVPKFVNDFIHKHKTKYD